jgi:glycosyltransferase involved in cell wall biosynthesis
MAGARVFVVSELYYPEETSTGYLLTRIAEGLAERFEVVALCAQPTYSVRGTRAPRSELRGGVRIRRCRGTTLDKNFLPFRILNLVTISLALFVSLVRELRRGDAALVVTNPPLLPFLTAVACRMRGARFLLLVHDVYPEVLYATGFLSRRARTARLLEGLNHWLYDRADRIVTLGRDMSDLVARKRSSGPRGIVMIPNWADADDITPADPAGSSLLATLGLAGRFVVQYAGNIGRSHDIESALAAAAQLGDEQFQFLFIGDGGKRRLVEQAARGSAANVTLLPNRPRSDQQVFLNACHVGLIPFVAGMSGVSVPSRMYNVLAAGKPIVAMADPDSELARVVREERVGWVVDPGDLPGLVGALRDAKAGLHGELAEMGRRARTVAAERYPLSRVVSAYQALIDDVAASPSCEAATARKASGTLTGGT